ncbi:VOC family protein [Govanella unica]|uniref:VOC family protein n=1 Tax=Govanella unica TaxID=2975056 RepID=A0A9X3Z726_9PROT|nr:VOC family protein [Govania unica]MDA5193800.1 VOC family protein [Govania unica]
MPQAVSPIPEGFEGVVPYLSMNGAAAALDFMTAAFDAVLVMCHDMPDGRIGHAEVRINGRPLMFADEFPDMNFKGPRGYGGSPVHLHLYVTDCDASIARAVAAGAKIIRPVADQFYGDRSGSIEDPFGHVWHLATRKEILTAEEIMARMPKANG